jgi:DNA-directed RNA polymerase specialized sigma subunit
MNKKPEDQQKIITVRLSEFQFDSLIAAIEKLAKAVAVAQIKEGQSTEQKARFLRTFGLTGREIADILGITEGRVSQILGTKKKMKETSEGLDDDTISKT